MLGHTRVVATLLFVLLAGSCERTAAVPTATPTSTARAPDTAAKPTADKPTAITIEALRCSPQVPDWERAVAAGWAWSLMYPSDFDGLLAARQRASEAVDQLDPDDPRFVEAHCRAGFAHHNMMNVPAAQRHFQTASAALRSKGIADLEQRYATLRHPVFAIEIEIDFDFAGKPTIGVRTTTGLSLDPDWCRTPDFALLELATASLFGSANSAQVKGLASNRPPGRSLGSLSADHAAALQDEVEAALGPNHPYAITMREHMSWNCREQQERRFPKRCPTLKALRKSNLERRIAKLGEQHADTRRTMIMLGGDELSAGHTDVAKKLFERAAAGEQDDSWVAANQALAVLELGAGKQREGFARLQRVALALPKALTDRYWDTQRAWRLHEAAAIHTGHREEAERARKEIARVEADYHYVGPGGPSTAIIAVMEKDGGTELRETAVEAVIALRTHQLAARGLTAAERAWRIEELDIALQCRALARHRDRNEAGASEDLRTLEILRKADPGAPD